MKALLCWACFKSEFGDPTDLSLLVNVFDWPRFCAHEHARGLLSAGSNGFQVPILLTLMIPADNQGDDPPLSLFNFESCSKCFCR